MATGSAKDLSGSQAETFLAASSKEAQQQFLELVGLCEEVHAMQETETVLTHEEALLMATALQHEPRDFVTRMGFEQPDRWFTEEEFDKYLEKVATVNAHMHETIQIKQLPSDASLAVYNSTLRATCGCVAHTSELSWVKELIDVATPINEYSGGIIATFLLQQILASTKTNVTVEKCSQGSPFSVAYAIKTTKMEVKFSGWPDHTFLSSPGDTGQRIPKCNRLVGVGETQSPPGKSLQALSAAIGQAGIYALGNLIRKGGPGGKLVVVVLSKVKTVVVLLMKLHEDILSFKFADAKSVAGFDLKDVHSLKHFALVMKRSLQWQAE